MTPLELVLTMLGETTTAEIAKTIDVKGFPQNLNAARSGGQVAGRARRDIEEKIGKKVITEDNYLPESRLKPIK